MNKTVTRFAPSPTGYLHVGGIRTALFAWLLARQNNGKFILRLEDTDKSREVEGADKHIVDSLHILGLDPDEGPIRQSDRLDRYKTWADKLVASGRAYADPYTPDEVQTFRVSAQKAKRPFLYRNHRPDNPPAWDGKQPLRFKSEPKSYSWHDEVMGDLTTGPEVIDDFVLIKSDGYPTYNFAHIVDDADMEVSHVIRGQEFLASTPNYLNLYEAMDISRPLLATVPHILGPDGKKKLSKRDGAKDVLDYVRDGYLPDALVSFISTLGWNDGTTQEIFSRDELIEKFNLSRVQKSGAKFDEQRLLWINGSLIRGMELNDLFASSTSYWPDSSQGYDDDYRKKVLSVVQERLKVFKEIPELTEFFFTEPRDDMVKTLLKDPRNKQLKKLDDNEIKSLLKATLDKLGDSNFSLKELEDKLNCLLSELNTKPGILFSIIRIATTGAPFSPALFDTLNVLGKQKSLARIEKAAFLI